MANGKIMGRASCFGIVSYTEQGSCHGNGKIHNVKPKATSWTLKEILDTGTGVQFSTGQELILFLVLFFYELYPKSVLKGKLDVKLLLHTLKSWHAQDVIQQSNTLLENPKRDILN